MEVRQDEIKEKKPKSWDEAINELKGFILKAKKEEAQKKLEEEKIKED